MWVWNVAVRMRIKTTAPKLNISQQRISETMLSHRSCVDITGTGQAGNEYEFSRF